MSKTKGLIGITGNIATGKSVVRRMLANAGALGLDADVIAHRMIYPQGPCFQPVVEAFGEAILNQNSEIDRRKLGEIVFQDRDQLSKLETIVHPAVSKAILKRLENTQSSFAALEAIKLLEAGLGEICDAIWVTQTPRDVQLARLLETRGLTEDEAQSRIDAQPPQSEKLDQADWVIHTDGAFQRTWKQVTDALNDTINKKGFGMAAGHAWEVYTPSCYDLAHEQLLMFWKGHAGASAPSLYEVLGTGMVEPLAKKGQIQALILWQEWNFTATLTQVLPGEVMLENLANVMDATQAAARRQGCELLLLDDAIINSFDLNPASLGFKQVRPTALTYPAWRMAAQKIQGFNETLSWALILAAPLEAEGNF